MNTRRYGKDKGRSNANARNLDRKLSDCEAIDVQLDSAWYYV